MRTILLDKGIARLVRRTNVQAGKWYLGFICQECGEKIYSLDDPSQGRVAPKVTGKGLFSVPCVSCGVDQMFYGTSDLIPMQADKDVILSRAHPRPKPTNCPRQPINKKYRRAAPIFDLELVEERPECAIIIARCITTWSYVETELALLLAAILGINHAPALAIFTALRNSRTQMELITAAATAALSKSDLKLFGAIMNLKSRFEGDRNDLAHGLFGFSHAIKDGVAWIHQQHNISHSTKAVASDYANIDLAELRKNTFVYELGDLETIAENFEWLFNIIRNFRSYVSTPDRRHVGLYRQLCAEPRVAQELSRMQNP